MVCGCGEAVKPVSIVMMAVALMMMVADDDVKQTDDESLAIVWSQRSVRYRSAGLT